ncbi:MAG: glycosyltransferase [Candidatus Riflebacteria bacterium]|nr:glycosyltransferase [Candidatus Riflebacteria bacterium]
MTLASESFIFPSLSIILPCYRARDYAGASIDAVGNAFTGIAGGFEIVAVEDGSADGSAEALFELARSRPWLRVVVHPENRGKGRAVLSGFKEARGRFVVMNDIDLQYDIDDMRLCYQNLSSGTADLVIGSRMHPASMYHILSRQIRYIFTRHVYSRILNFAIRKFFLPGVRDTQCGLKGFSRSFVDIVNRGLPIIEGFAFDIELLVIARENNLSITEIPVHFHYTDIPSTVKFVKTAGRLVKDLLRIFAHRLAGRYVSS